MRHKIIEVRNIMLEKIDGLSGIAAATEGQAIDVEAISINGAPDSDQEVIVPIDAENSMALGFWNVFKSISAISIPMALSFTFSFEIFLMTILLNYSSENEDEAASVTLIATMINTLAIIGMSPLFAMNNIASNKIGELMAAEERGDNEDSLIVMREYISGINRNGLIISAAITPVVMSGMIFSKPLLTHVLGQNDNVAQITQNYLRAYSPAVLGLMTRISSEQMMFSFNRSKQAMGLGLISLGVGTGISILLERSGLGSTGIAIGYTVEAYLTSLLYGLYLARNKDFSKFSFFRIFKTFEGQCKQLLSILEIGRSITSSVVSEMAMALSVGLLSGVIGPAEQSAMTDINQFVFFNFLALSSFGLSTSQELNRLIGAKKYEQAHHVAKYGLLTTLIYTTPVPLFFAIAPRFLVVSNNHQNRTSESLTYLVPIMSAGVILDSVRYNLLQQLRVLKDLNGSTIISVTSLAAGITASGLLGLKTRLGIYGVALGYSGGIILACPGLLYRWQSRMSAQRIKETFESPQPIVASAGCFGRFFNKGSKANQTRNAELVLDGAQTNYNTLE